jgi:hypothetical protein
MNPAESFQIMNQLRNPNTKQKGVNKWGGKTQHTNKLGNKQGPTSTKSHALDNFD